MMSLFTDLRFGIRTLFKTPTLSAVAILSMAVGIGANTAIFSVLHGVLLQPLPYPDSPQLVHMWIQWPEFGGAISDADLMTWVETQQRFTAVGAYDRESNGFTLITSAGPQIVDGSWLSRTMPAVLGVEAAVGRTFAPDDDSAALISHHLWMDRFGGSEKVLGDGIELDSRPFTIVGVMPPGFAVPGQEKEDVWPLLEFDLPSRQGPFYLSGVGRLEEGADLIAAREDLLRTQSALQERFPDASDNWRYEVELLRQAVVGNTNTTLWLLMGAVSLVLLIAIGNVANLLLSRSTARSREMATRAALGAAPTRLVRQLITEAAVLGLIGSLAGLALAFWGVQLISVAGVSFVPRLHEVEVNLTVLAFTLVLGVAAGVLAGLAPAIQIPWRKLGQHVRESGATSSAGSASTRLRQALVIGEFALAFTVITAAGLLLRSMMLLQHEDLGFPTQGLVTWRIDLPEEAYGDSAAWVEFFDRLEVNLLSVPGVTGVGFSTSLPPNELRMTNNYNLEGDESSTAGQQLTAEWMLASEGYFTTLGIPVLSGRPFTADDRPGITSVAVVNETFARRHFPDRDAVGARFQGGDFDPDGNWLTIVGIAADVPYDSGATGGIAPTVYTPFLQNPWRGLYTSIRTSTGDPAALMPTVRKVVSDLDPRIPVRDLALMEERVRRSEAPARFRTLLFSILAVVGLVLATSGIYAAMAYSVTRRRREIAIRMALGADNAKTLKSILWRGFRISTLGLGLGLIGSLILTRSLRSVLYEVSPMDATTLVGAATLLAAVALAASLLPALSATRTDPADVLRDE